MEKMSEEHDKLRKSFEEDIKTKVTVLQNKLTNCNQELENKLKKIFPDYDVS